MRFLIDGRYIQDHFPGIGRYTYNLIDALARAAPDEKFRVLHNPALKNTRYDVAALAKYQNIELQPVAIRTFSADEQFQLTDLIRDSKSVLFHSPYFIKPYFLPVPSVVTIFDLIPIHYPNELPNAPLRLIFRLAVSLAARTAARVIAPSAAACEDLITHLRVPRRKVAVTLLGVEPRFAPQPEAAIAAVREKYKLPSRYILYVGSNKPHKNLGVLIQAWSRTDVDAALVIAGAWDKRYAPQRHEDDGPGLPNFLHDVPDADLPALYSGATVFVMPSLYEGFGLPLLEAMACGAPTIALNASCLPEVGGDAALYIEPGDTHGLALLLSKILKDRMLQAELHDKSLARAALFSWERTARETLAVYRSVAN